MVDREPTREELTERVKCLERLVFALAEKLLTVAEHLGHLAEKKERRCQ